MKIEVNKDGRTFNPDKLKLSSSLAPNIVFTYYTTASPGMIYWDVNVREKKDPLTDVTVINMDKSDTDDKTSNSKNPATKALPENEDIAAAAGLVILLGLLGLATGNPELALLAL